MLLVLLGVVETIVTLGELEESIVRLGGRAASASCSANAACMSRASPAAATCPYTPCPEVSAGDAKPPEHAPEVPEVPATAVGSL